MDFIKLVNKVEKVPQSLLTVRKAGGLILNRELGWVESKWPGRFGWQTLWEPQGGKDKQAPAVGKRSFLLYAASLARGRGRLLAHVLSSHCLGSRSGV